MTKSGPVGTTTIGIRPATNLFHAARFARETGRAPTITVAINWDRLGIGEDLASASFRRVRLKVRRRWKHLRLTDPTIGSLDDMGAHENPGGRRNTHWSVHVPAHALSEFKRSLLKFLAVVVKLNPLPPRAVRFTEITSLGGHVKYLAKGIRSDAAEYFHMRAVPQGFVSGRGRTFVSRSLGFKARKEASWKRKRRPRSYAGS